MAKGFTVKAKNPVKSKPKKEEWDYALARQLIKGKTVAVSYTHLTLPTNLCV